MVLWEGHGDALAVEDSVGFAVTASLVDHWIADFVHGSLLLLLLLPFFLFLFFFKILKTEMNILKYTSWMSETLTT